MKRWLARGVLALLMPVPVGALARGPYADGGICRDWLAGVGVLAVAGLADWAERHAGWSRRGCDPPHDSHQKTTPAS